MIKQDDFRSAMSRLGGAVTLVTTDGPGGRHGLAATAVCSVTDTPPTLLVCVNQAARSNSRIKANGVFCVNVLCSEHEDLVSLFGQNASDTRFADDRQWTTLATGSPSLTSALASLDCRVEQQIEVGTHTLFIGAVQALRLGPARHGLIYFARRLQQVIDTDLTSVSE